MSEQFTGTVGRSSFTFEVGKLALQANGAVTVRDGDTALLVAATASKEPREGVTFFPLRIDVEERLYAAGRIPGSFFRREGRPSEEATLLCRLTDRPLRPLFPKGFRNDVQVIITALSADQEHHLDIPTMIGSSAALTISDIPFYGPIGAVRVAYVDGEFVFNPTLTEMEESVLDLRMTGTAEAVTMVEADGNEVPEEVVVEAIRRGHEEMQEIIEIQLEMAEKVGKPKRDFPVALPSDEVREAVGEYTAGRLSQILEDTTTKEERSEAIDDLRGELASQFEETFDEQEVKDAFDELWKEEVRSRILDKGVRPDGRDATEVRPVSTDVGLAARAHGSGLFTRGLTQVLSIATLGTVGEEQTLDTLSPTETKRYMHHYNFPPFSTGETWPLRGPGRREIGHGALAENALRPMLPPDDDFPYAIRVVSEVLSSNGSTSMASVCASSLALMDGGIPIRAPVAGIAMGMVQGDDSYRILTDIQGVEDALGDMDFKVAGTREGINALQMDIKTKGLTYEVMEEALAQAREARLLILDKMAETIAEPRPELSPHAPRITIVKIDPQKIGAVIGSGGKTIRKIIEETGVDIDVEDDGSVYIASTDGPSAEQAVNMVKELTEEPEVGKIYKGKVVRTTNYGAFVEILPGQDGMVHISQLADYRVPSVEDVVKPGDEIMVMVTNIDSQGKVRLSRQAVLEGWSVEEARRQDSVPGKSRSRRR